MILDKSADNKKNIDAYRAKIKCLCFYADIFKEQKHMMHYNE